MAAHPIASALDVLDEELASRIDWAALAEDLMQEISRFEELGKQFAGSNSAAGQMVAKQLVQHVEDLKAVVASIDDRKLA